MTWGTVWIFLKEIPLKVWLGVVWAACLIGWWLSRSQLAKEKAKNVRLEHKHRQIEIRKESLLRLHKKKERIQKELVKARKETLKKAEEIAGMDVNELAEELNREFGDN